VYLAVLGASMIITVLGVAGIFVVRLQAQTTTTANHAVRATAASASVIDLARLRLNTSATWRTDHTNNTWIADITFDGGRIAYKLVDEADGNLANDSTTPVRVYGRAVFGKALRMQSVLVNPDGTGKLVAVAGSWRQEVLP
jgi:type II secretory pathway component PulK